MTAQPLWIRFIAGLLFMQLVGGLWGSANWFVHSPPGVGFGRAWIFPAANLLVSVVAGVAGLGLWRRRPWGRCGFVIWAVLEGLVLAWVLWVAAALAGVRGWRWGVVVLAALLLEALIFGVARAVWRRACP
jgi:FtsH-binding integral membrane protein